MEQRTIIAIVLILAALVAGYFLFTGFQRPAPVPEITFPPQVEEPSQEEEVVVEKEVRQVDVSGTEFRFTPSSITLKEGERVRVVFTNIGSAPHDFTIEGLGIKTKVIGSGQTDSIEFVAPASGNYTFFCSVPGHRQAGMEGNIKVE
jgi:uncharacterized cupredoxin-like copper-binding protein